MAFSHIGAWGDDEALFILICFACVLGRKLNRVIRMQLNGQWLKP